LSVVLLLCFLSFSPSYKERIIKEWVLIGLSLNHEPRGGGGSADSTSGSVVEVGAVLISSLCSWQRRQADFGTYILTL